MKILFVIPPWRTSDKIGLNSFPLPLGPVLVATVLKQRGHTVVIKDFLVGYEQASATPPGCYAGKHAPGYRHYGTPMDEVEIWLRANAPDYDVVGLCPCQCNLFETGTLVADILVDLGLPIVGGGPFVTTATPEAVRRFSLDVAVTYEGEWVAEEAFERAIAGETGVVLDGRESIKPMAELPVPDWSLAPLDTYPKYNGKVRGVLTVSRGCPWKCIFCSVYSVMGRKHRRQNQQRIKEELKSLWDFGVRYFCFLDDNLFISPKATNEVLGAIDELDAEVPGFARCKFYTEEGMEIRMVAKPGFLERLTHNKRWENLAIGLETASAGRAKKALKPYTPEEMQAAVANCKRLGILANAFYVIALPGDTLKTIAEDFVEFASFGLAARPNNLKVYPGTTIEKMFREQGLINDTYDWRLSSFYTVPTKHFTYPLIRKLKAILRAIGCGCEDFGINIFKDSFEEIVAGMAAARYTLIKTEAGGLQFTGNIWRPTQYQILCEILCAREAGSGYAKSKAEKNLITATPTTKPKHAAQAAVFAAMRGTAQQKTGLLF